ncbi:MAG: hypothetical protein ACXVHI_04985 [Frankiaceae bacterium]
MGRVTDPGARFPGYRFPAIIIGEVVCLVSVLVLVEQRACR